MEPAADEADREEGELSEDDVGVNAVSAINDAGK